MSVEAATYISDFVAANPAASDVVSDGATHLRLIKQVLKNTFPSLTGAVSVDQKSLARTVPIGAIMMWTGTIATVPAGWAWAAGQTVAKSDGSGNITLPDLRGKFVIAAQGDTGTTYNTFSTGGATTHAHGFITGSHVLSGTEMPTHTHTISDPGHVHGLNDPGHRHAYFEFSASNSSAGAGTSNPTVVGSNFSTVTDFAFTGISMANAVTGITGTNSNGSSLGHTHSLTSDSNVPPYYAIAFIVRV